LNKSATRYEQQDLDPNPVTDQDALIQIREYNDMKEENKVTLFNLLKTEEDEDDKRLEELRREGLIRRLNQIGLRNK